MRRREDPSHLLDRGRAPPDRPRHGPEGIMRPARRDRPGPPGGAADNPARPRHPPPELDHLEDPGPAAVSGPEAPRAADRLMQARPAALVVPQAPAGQHGPRGPIAGGRPLAVAERP